MKGKRRIIHQDEMHVLFYPEVEFSPEECEEAARNGGVLRGRGAMARYFFALFEAMGVPSRREVEQWADECDAWLAANALAHDPPSQGWFVLQLQDRARRYLRHPSALALNRITELQKDWLMRANLPALKTGMKQRKHLDDLRENHNQKQTKGASAEHARYQAEADRIWLRRPELTKQAVAKLVKSKLNAPQKVETIADRLKKVPNAR